MSSSSAKKSFLQRFGPGLLVAATGVGAGDLYTGAISGNKLGTIVLWAVLVGALLKFVLTEGLARWQLATGETLLQGTMSRFGRPVQLGFLLYLIIWSYFVAAALMNACGAAASSIFKLPALTPEDSKIVYGIAHSLLAVLLIFRGGFKLFEKLMTVCIGMMFVIVCATVVLVNPDWTEILSGLLIPRIPFNQPEGVDWTLGLIGGVGGTLTILCYGYWLREAQNDKEEMSLAQIKEIRIDLGLGYIMTAIFGLSMVIIGSQVAGEGKGVQLLIDLANQLAIGFGTFGHVMKWLFLIGAWGAVFSSLLGVWQSVPYLFADFWNQSFARTKVEKIDHHLATYRAYLWGLATIPMLGLFTKFEEAQKFYAVFGACFIPLLAIILILLNGSTKYIPAPARNRPLTTVVLCLTLVFFSYILCGKLF